MLVVGPITALANSLGSVLSANLLSCCWLETTKDVDKTNYKRILRLKTDKIRARRECSNHIGHDQNKRKLRQNQGSAVARSLPLAWRKWVQATLERTRTSFIPLAEMPSDQWWVCSTWAGYETSIADLLLHRRLNYFFPTIRVKKKRVNGAGREYKVETERALFPRYIFLSGAESRDAVWLHSSRSEAKSTIWPVASKSQSTLHEELMSIATAIEANPYLQAEKGIRKGDRAMIIAGPYMGVSGTVEQINTAQMTVWICCAIMGQSVPVEVPREMVEVFDT